MTIHKDIFPGAYKNFHFKKSHLSYNIKLNFSFDSYRKKKNFPFTKQGFHFWNMIFKRVDFEK